MFFKKLANGKYRYYEKFYDESEEKWKQASVTLTSKTRQAQGQAKRELDSKIEKKLTKCKLRSRKNKQYTFNEVLDEYLLFRKQELKDSSFYVYKGILNNLFKEILDKKFNEVSSSYFQNKIMSSNSSISYKRSQKGYANLFFKYAMKIGYTNFNLIDGVQLPRDKKTIELIEKKRCKFLSRDEFHKFKESFGKSRCQIRMNYLIEFMYLTGLRIGEALALMWENVDLEKKMIDIRHTIDYSSASLKDFKITAPKTSNSYRKISINSRCIEIINEMKILNEDFNLNAKKFIFLNSQGRLINHNLLNIYIKKIGVLSGLKGKNPRDFSSHMFRHSHISLLTELGIPVKAIMSRVGHINEKTTIQIYTHVTKNMELDISEKMESI
ncbi:MAG: site-specific integrase [Bacilli bacterium]|nr:site-specific integrase [Bacilli bacterium]MBR2708665.1 site-specific integrase [Bacilli bacterium]MBR3199682.1 site-specific integrase [Bacilli bacterium]